MSFKKLGLSSELLRAITETGYTEPTPIQQQAIPVILQGRDLMAAAQTGTGKTAGFTLPMLHLLMLSGKNVNAGDHCPVRALILTPTRELAAQVHESVLTYGKHLPLKSMVAFGGVKIGPQINKLTRGVDILIATPGRLLDLVQQKVLDLSLVEILVLDEADRMLDMGFINDIRRVISYLPKKRLNLLFSATFSSEIRKLASGIMHAPLLVEVAPANSTAEGVTQVIHPVDRKRKAELLSSLIRSQGWIQALVFTRTKHGADQVVKYLEHDGITSIAIHGNKSQNNRTKALAGFKDGDVRILVATDIAARGLDIDKLPHVVNFDLPNIPEDYVHRIGRTGRAKNQGAAISLVCIDELGLLRDIERVIKQSIPVVVIPGFTPDPSIRAEPIQKPRIGGSYRNARPGSGPQQRRAPSGSASSRPSESRYRDDNAKPTESRYRGEETKKYSPRPQGDSRGPKSYGNAGNQARPARFSSGRSGQQGRRGSSSK